jgi:predicted ATPase/class 3 adenylate cyclase
LGILGPIEIWDEDGAAVPLTPQLRRLLGVLVTAGGATVSSERIAEHVADGRTDGSVIRTAVSRLRKTLGDRIETSGNGYRLVVTTGELDADRFVELCEMARTAAPADQRALLIEALALWRGPIFDDLSEEPWALVTAARLKEMRAVATEDLGEVLIELGRANEAVGLLESHVVEQPLRERPVALLMRALAATGRVPESLRWFQRFRTTMREEVGIEPTSALRELAAELLGGLDPDREVPCPTPRELPTGTVTFVFTDIEGSTERWAHDELAMSSALAMHDSTIRSVVDRHGGWVFKHTGDGVCAVFTSAPAAVAAAIDAQDLLSLPVRIGVHTGEAELRDGDYFGPTMNRTARVMDAGHGGQILVSSSAASLADDVELVDLGEHHLKGLATPERLFQVGTKNFPHLRVARQRLGNIPMELTTFIGRGNEVSHLAGELADSRLVTLIGVGGTGKTRMAVEVAHATAPMFPDGCWLVELAPVAVEDAVPFAFAGSLGITAPTDRDIVGDLTRRLRQKRALVVVDNCEHVLSTVADVVERLVAACPSVTVLATSREPLMVSGERLVPVTSLAISDAERLFVERAHSEAPDLVIDDAQSAAIHELCLRLDCLPLAIELAASRVRGLTPVELVANLDERFRLLVGGRRSRMERHQTMRGTLDWSYDLCSDAERAVFDRLAVFPAGFDLKAARAVAAVDGVSELDVVDIVPQLVDRSLLQRAAAVDGTTRYRMLETMRAYGREHLQHSGAADTIRERHARYMCDRLSRLALRQFGPDERVVRQRLIDYLPDIQVALEWFIDHREWDEAMQVSFVCQGIAERATAEMATRLYEAVLASGDEVDFIDLLKDMLGQSMAESEVTADARAWRRIRSGRPTPPHRFSPPPHLSLAAASVSYEEAEELLASLDQLADAPPVVRYMGQWATIRCLIFSGHFHLVDEPLTRFEQLVEELDSENAKGGIAELRGHLAAADDDWITASRWFAETAATQTVERPNWFRLTIAWHALTARAICGERITGQDLREPWQWFRSEGINVLAWHGAVSTAVALDRLGRRDLAERLVRWARQSDPGGVMPRFERTLAAAGMYVERAESFDDLDDLIDEVIAFADELDRHAQFIGAPVEADRHVQ